MNADGDRPVHYGPTRYVPSSGRRPSSPGRNPLARFFRTAWVIVKAWLR